MNILPDILLLEAYEKAKELNLNLDFINMIKLEITERNLFVKDN